MVPHSGDIKGKWVANLKRGRMALKLDLSLDGLGLNDLSLSVPDSRSPESPPSHPVADGPVEPERWEAESNCSQSIMTFGSCPSTAPPLSDLPLTPIPELLHTPTPPKRMATPNKTSPVSNNHPHAHPRHRLHFLRQAAAEATVLGIQYP
jgi:hypothetical protein